MIIWGFLSVAAVAVLVAYWRKGPNAVRGTATVGAVIGAIYQPSFDWWTVGKAAVIGTFIGLAFELLPLVPRLWTTGSNARNRQLAEERYEKKLKIALDFGSSLEKCPEGLVRDTTLLPYPKQELLDALLLSIISAPNEQLADAFGVAAMALSGYQDGVGTDPITIPGADNVSNIEKLSPSELQQYLKGFDFDRIVKFIDTMTAEGHEIMELIGRAKAVNHLLMACAQTAYEP